MTNEEKLEKIIKCFSQLPEDKQDYILGVLQALDFAHETADEKPELEKPSADEKSIKKLEL